MYLLSEEFGNLPSVMEWPLRVEMLGQHPAQNLSTLATPKARLSPQNTLLPLCKTPLTSKVWSLEGEGGYISLKSLGPVTRLLKCLDIAGWEMHKGYLIADITKLSEFILYATRAHQRSVLYRLTIANSTRLGGGLGKALWKHTC